MSRRCEADRVSDGCKTTATSRHLAIWAAECSNQPSCSARFVTPFFEHVCFTLMCSLEGLRCNTSDLFRLRLLGTIPSNASCVGYVIYEGCR